MWTFYLFGALAIAASLMVIAQRNPIYSVLLLIASFGALSGLYVLLDAPFVAVVQIIVYAGAIMVLFLFVIMLLGAERTGRTASAWWLQPLALGLGLVLLLEALYIVFSQQGAFPSGGTPSAAFGSPANIGEVLFSQYLLPFEVTSILLLTAMIGAIVLSRRRSR